MKPDLKLNQILDTLQRYNIPQNAKIELSTGWECSETELNALYYNFRTNTLALVSSGVEYWYDVPDWIKLETLSYTGKLENLYNF